MNKEYIVNVREVDYFVSASSARRAVDAVLRSLVGTRIAEKYLKMDASLLIKVREKYCGLATDRS